MDNPIVKKSLSCRYKMVISNKTNTVTENYEYFQHEWKQMSRDNSEINDNQLMGGFICVQCKNSLQLYNPKISDQACANGLLLNLIPQDLQHLSSLERRIISYQIPLIA